MRALPGIGNITILEILKEFPQIQSDELSLNNLIELLNTQNIKPRRKISVKALKTHLKRVEESINKHDIKIITVLDPEYPESLKKIFNAPAVLFYKGNIKYDFDKSLAIVGTRKATPYGQSACALVTKGLSAHKFTIISGLAAGIDSISHKLSLKEKMKCIGVVGQGLEYVYPHYNKSLYDEILHNDGCIISEFVPWQIPLPAFFPLRNRIIAGMARATLVIEAAIKSGSLITAKAAFDENREVFAIPSDINYPSRQGGNEIIKRGIAKLITNPKDIINEFGIQNLNDAVEIAMDSNPRYKNILKTILSEPISTERLALKLNMSVENLSVALTELELEDTIIKNDHGNWIYKN